MHDINGAAFIRFDQELWFSQFFNFFNVKCEKITGNKNMNHRQFSLWECSNINNFIDKNLLTVHWIVLQDRKMLTKSTE